MPFVRIDLDEDTHRTLKVFAAENTIPLNQLLKIILKGTAKAIQKMPKPQKPLTLTQRILAALTDPTIGNDIFK